MMNYNDAKKMCAKNKNYYIAWTYAGYENEMNWRTKRAAEEYRDRVEVPEYAKTKADAAKFWPVFMCLYAVRDGLERNVIVDEIK